MKIRSKFNLIFLFFIDSKKTILYNKYIKKIKVIKMKFNETKFSQKEMKVNSVQLVKYDYLDYGMV